jgi:hypothetical protein
VSNDGYRQEPTFNVGNPSDSNQSEAEIALRE